MATKTINVEMLAKMFLAGAQNIESKKEFINELNVFPVPDGDTGTNMSLTIMSAAKEVTALTDYNIRIWPRRFLPVLCPSSSGDLPNPSGRRRRSTQRGWQRPAPGLGIRPTRQL